MASSMTINSNCDIGILRSKRLSILPASITRVFIVTYITHTEYNRKFKAKTLKTMPFTNNGWLPLENGNWKSNPEFSAPPVVTEADRKK